MLKLEKDQILLSRFSLIRPLGEGAMGQVWLVRDLELEVDIAIKALNPRFLELRGRIELLKNECRNTRNLSHPNIVRVFDFHRDAQGVFISMEYIDGQDLAAYRRNFQHRNDVEMIWFLEPIAKALSYAHQTGLVHRDIKSSNILIDKHHTPHLTDFGIAGVFKSGSDALDITTGGSLYSMSPQQLDGRPPQPADDIYAFGILMYELLAGHPPFYPDITADKIQHHRPPSVNQKLLDQQLRPEIPVLLEDLIDQMLAKTAAERPADMQTIASSLQAIRQHATTQTVPPLAATPGSTKSTTLKPAEKIITPLQVSADRTQPGQGDANRGQLLKILALAAVFAGLLAGGGLLLYFLSTHPLETTDRQEPAPQPQIQVEKTPILPAKSQPAETQDSAAIARQKQTAEQKLAEYMALKDELDRRGAAQWGGEAYGRMAETARQADGLLMDQSYELAAEKYSAAGVSAESLADRAGDVLQKLLQAGHHALEQGDGSLAREKFTLALMIEPTHTAAAQGLHRSETIAEVMQLLATGKQHEENGRLSFARTDYQRALNLDPLSETAKTAVSRVQAKIRNQKFQQLISEGLTAFHNHDYRLARSKLLKAKSFKPGSREVLDALDQVDAAIRLSQIETLKQKAAAARDGERWTESLDANLQILKIDPAIQFAIEGKQYSLQRIKLEKRVKFFLDTPRALESDRQLENAVLLLQELNAIASKGPKLSARIDQLEKRITAAQTPIKVIIESDSLTEVAVYKIAKLGRFSIHELDLRPGTYTVVGARDGYKDIHRKIVIKAGQKPMRIIIKCTVKI
jgi:serine/threonine protein kinase